MNYLAHGVRSLGDAWLLAGTALPDWLRVLDRRLRISAERAAECGRDPDPQVAALARGVACHLDDDRAFHSSDAFHAATRDVAAVVRRLAADVPGLRASFVAHILVEVCLDAEIVRADPAVLDQYYEALGGLDADTVERATARLTPAPPERLARLIRAFVSSRFIGEYLDDAAAVRRLDAVFVRVRQPALGEALTALVPAARAIVRREFPPGIGPRRSQV